MALPIFPRPTKATLDIRRFAFAELEHSAAEPQRELAHATTIRSMVSGMSDAVRIYGPLDGKPVAPRRP
jgi:hypothetical protein